MINPIRWSAGQLTLLDQRLLPQQEKYVDFTDWGDVVTAIQRMVVRGAPAIGISGAWAVVMAAASVNDGPDWRGRLAEHAELIADARPTAVNLRWAVERMMRSIEGADSLAEARHRLEREAAAIHEEDLAINRRIGAHGDTLIKNGFNVLTICNTGSLATAGFGTALGVIRAAHASGKGVHVFVSETRPRLQGMRLTAWELKKEGIPFTLISDNMAAFLMAQGKVDCVIAGADRIAANGDTANKIGTYSLAALADFHNLPFFIAAPLSTIDLQMADGQGIPIEERPCEEVTAIEGVPIAPEGCAVYNPAFDVTPGRLIDGIITEEGVATGPYEKTLPALFAAAAPHS